MQYLAGVENLLTAGRPGLYLNNDIHDSMELGFVAARHVLSCLKYQMSQPWYEQISTFKQTKGW
jgi:hypothetical protein